MIHQRLYLKSLWENCCAGAFFLIKASGVENHFQVNFIIFITFLQKTCTRFKIQLHCKKNEVSIKDFFSKCDQICSFLWIWSHILKKSLMENFIFLCSVFFLFHVLANLEHFIYFSEYKLQCFGRKYHGKVISPYLTLKL